MALRHTNLHKGLCGLLVALALVALPLPALADNEPDVEPTEDTVVSAPAEAISQPVTTQTLAETTPEPAAVIETAPIETSPSLAETSSSDTPTSDSLSTTPTVTATNNLNSGATSGDATVTNNETAGNATSGNAGASATVINVANANGATVGNFTTFQCDVDKDTAEDLIIDPNALPDICKTTAVGTSAQPATSTQGLQTGASLVDILNNIVLSASSGSANVTDNETAGDATSGDAAALANIVNIANSSISAKKSFLGIININAELKGNILVPQSLVDGLMGGNSNGQSIDTTSINNTINAAAASGNATVAGNETAGSATSGDAATSVTILNLTGQEVVAKNSLLVFVNVMGKWMGLIVPAPVGSKTAMLGSGIQQSGQSLGSQANGEGDTATNITNNISVKAQSGDANVTGNETAGNATSGKASAGVNLLNITNSNFLLDDWFGALFINVLGIWSGNFDILAAAQASGDPNTQPVQAVKVFQLTESTKVTSPAAVSRPATTTASYSAEEPTAEPTPVSPASKVLGYSTEKFADSVATQPVKLNAVALAAIVVALTLAIATAMMVIRRNLSA